MSAQRVAAFAAIVIVIVIVVAAFGVLGPPTRARAQALDRQRVDDLQHIAQEMHNQFGNAGESLPLHLLDPRRDPITRKPYDYRRLDPKRYVLCATFQLAGPPNDDRDGASGSFWHHSAGRFCYRLDARRDSSAQGFSNSARDTAV